jgi:hypothetical protein
VNIGTAKPAREGDERFQRVEDSTIADPFARAIE